MAKPDPQKYTPQHHGQPEACIDNAKIERMISWHTPKLRNKKRLKNIKKQVGL